MKNSFILFIFTIISIRCDPVKYTISSCTYSKDHNLVTFRCSSYKNDRIFQANTMYHCDNEEVVFKKATIKKVAFHDCELQHIPRELYVEYGEIQVLNISNLGLRWLYLEEARKVVKLFASHNKLRMIPKYMGKIEEIDLSYNEIDGTTLEESRVSEFFGDKSVTKERRKQRHFPSLNKVKTLNLSYNNFRKLNGEIFENFRELRYLNLSYNQIKKIKPMTLMHQRKLRTLDLSNNMLVSLSNNIFVFPSKHLKLLLLSANNLLQVISGFTPSNYPSLSIVGIKDNRNKNLKKMLNFKI